MRKVSVIIPAAGAGKRFGGSVKKPFAQLDGRPVFIRSVELFVNRPDVVEILLAVSPDDVDVVREKFAANLMVLDIRLIKGGNERFESVLCALNSVDPSSDLVCVHDAVRPCVLPGWIDAVFACAEEHGAAILGSPLTGTVKRTDGTEICETVPRKGLIEAQTPQVFQRQLLIDAYAKLDAAIPPTDDAQLVERLGRTVRVIESDRRNLKITTHGDLELAEATLKQMDTTRRKSGGSLGAFEEAQW